MNKLIFIQLIAYIYLYIYQSINQSIYITLRYSWEAVKWIEEKARAWTGRAARARERAINIDMVDR